MTWTLLCALTAALLFAVLVLWARRRELAEMAGHAEELARAKERGSHKARLQYPEVDLAKCIGCGSCVRACPEEGVLQLIHGQAIVVHGARCVGHGVCAKECPTGGVVVRLGDLEERRDIPALTPELMSTRTEGLYLAGEVTGFALIKTAIEHGREVAREVARKKSEAGGGVLDLLIVGAGPAGLSCSLEAKNQGLDYLMVDQDRLGGTVAHYPRRKLVLLQPVELPRHGKLSRTTYEKEELIELWDQIADKEELPFETGLVYEEVERGEDGVFSVHFAGGEVRRARAVCMALGRRGSPRKLGIPGEELPKVSYGLVDAESYTDRDILVVGGGDSAIEAALGLAEQPKNRVTLSYRRKGFFRIKAKNEARLEAALAAGELEAVMESNVLGIDAHEVTLALADEALRTLPNDDVFVLAGGVPPFDKLERAGVSFDPADRPALVTDEDTSGLFLALLGALAGTALALAWSVVFRDYYALPLAERPHHDLDLWLRPSGRIGLGLGISAAVLILANLAYLLRKSARIPLWIFSLQSWMTSHVATGVLALVIALLHAAMAPKDTVGGHALIGLVVLVVTGGIGRYFYSFVPHAANGRDMQLDEVRARLTALTTELDREHRGIGERIHAEVESLIQEGHWQRSLPRRIVALLFSRHRIKEARRALRKDALEAGLPEDQLRNIESLVRTAQRTALAAAHFEDLRGLLASWRYLHRWVAVLMVLLVIAHIVTALRFGGLLPTS
jgi:thioredoxin reductase